MKRSHVLPWCLFLLFLVLDTTLGQTQLDSTYRPLARASAQGDCSSFARLHQILMSLPPSACQAVILDDTTYWGILKFHDTLLRRDWDDTLLTFHLMVRELMKSSAEGFEYISNGFSKQFVSRVSTSLMALRRVKDDRALHLLVADATFREGAADTIVHHMDRNRQKKQRVYTLFLEVSSYVKKKPKK